MSTAGVSPNAAKNSSYSPAISDDGTIVAFRSYASNLSAEPTGGFVGVYVYVYDLYGPDGPHLVSRPSSGAPDGGAIHPSISGNGRYVTYTSWATNLAGGEAGIDDIFVTDTTTGSSRLISRTASGAGADQHSRNPAISADGAFVTFESTATNLTNGNTAGMMQVFVVPRVSGPARAVSRTPRGAFGDSSSESPDVSGNGRYLVFQTQAANLSQHDTEPLTFDTYRWDRVGDT